MSASSPPAREGTADNLVRLRPGRGPAVVCVHGAGGLVTGFRRLAPHLDVPGPVWALENLEPGPQDRCSIGALARHYWEQVEPQLTDGLHLVGWSFGGPVIVEMAALAEDAGHEVGTVVLLDAAAPHMLRRRSVDLLEDLAALFEASPDDLPPTSGVVTVDEALDVVARALQDGHRGVTADDLRPFAEVYAWHLEALRAGGALRRPRARVVLVRAVEERGWEDCPEDLGWGEALGREPELVRTAGTHHTVMAERHVGVLGATLDDVLHARRSPDGRTSEEARG